MSSESTNTTTPDRPARRMLTFVLLIQIAFMIVMGLALHDLDVKVDGLTTKVDDASGDVMILNAEITKIVEDVTILSEATAKNSRTILRMLVR